MKERIPPIVERLRRPYTRIPGTGERLINPDGPEGGGPVDIGGRQ